MESDDVCEILGEHLCPGYREIILTVTVDFHQIAPGPDHVDGTGLVAVPE